MGSVALGLVAGLFVLSVYKGIMTDRVRTVIDTEVSHLQIHHRAFKEDFDPQFIIPQKEELIGKLQDIKLISAFTTRTLAQGMIATATGSSGIIITAVHPTQENTVTQINSKIIAGSGFNTTRKNPAIVGKKLLEKMHLKENSKIVLTFTDKESNIVSAAFKVCGVYETDNAPQDERNVYVRQEDLNSLLGMENEFHEIAILLVSDNAVENAKTALLKTFPDLQVESWDELSAETKLMLDTTEEYSSIFIAIIMIALSFGIVNSMLMAVLERSREIGMLLALGMNRMKVFSMMLTETLLLTLTGAPVGVFITWLIVGHYHVRGLDISNLGEQAMSSFGFSSMI
jgi:ABC-type lipoprotein release transport system permease subunit